MDNSDLLRELMERVEALERQWEKLSLNEAKEVIIKGCPIGDLTVGANCQMAFHDSSIGAIMNDDIDDAEGRLDDLESRLDEINGQIDEAEGRMEELGDH